MKVDLFLKSFPDKWLLFLVYMSVFGLYMYDRSDFAGQLMQTVIGALLGILVGRATAPQTSVNADTSGGDFTVNTAPKLVTPESKGPVQTEEER